MIKEGVVLGGRYEIMERIGTGGMADVYKAIDRVLRRYVAVKVLKREFREDENFVRKFQSEAQSAAMLTHPNIVNVYDVAEDRGLHYIVMELVEGITLKDYIQKKGKLTPKEVIGIIMQVCAGIDSAHSNNIVHRDIKPQNIMISKEGKVKVTDFGIAKATSSNTISTNAMGSVHYTSPEQARGGFSDEKSDIYSLGVTMYEMVTGQLPFDGDSTVSIALKHLQEDLIPPSEFVPDIPYSLEQIILKCTQKSPDRRYVDVAMLARDLKRSIQDPDGDFVRIAPIAGMGDSKSLTPDEMARIREAAEFNAEYEDDYDEYYEEERRRRQRAKNGKADVDRKMSNVMKVLTITAAVIFVGLVIGLMVYVIGSVNGKFGQNVTEGVEKNIVPNMIGMKLDEAKDACAKAGITLQVVVEEKSVEYDKDIIFKQLTQSGTKLPEGARVQVHVSTGLKDIEIPDVTGEDEDDAIKELKSLGFKEKYIEVEEEEHMTVKKGDVIRTNPKAGKIGNSKTKIIIYVSKGVGKTEVPNVEGKNREEAEKLLTSAGLKVEVQLEQSDEIEGRVLSQGIEPGKEVDKGTVVTLVVSAGNEVEIPTDLVGKNYKDVKKALEDLGLKVKAREDSSKPVKAAGEVTEVQNAGEKWPIDIEITIYYSNNVESTGGTGTGTGSGTGTSGTN